MSETDLFAHNRLSPYERGIIERAELAEHHRLHQTGGFRKAQTELFAFIYKAKREQRVQAAKEARSCSQ